MAWYVQGLEWKKKNNQHAKKNLERELMLKITLQKLQENLARF